MTARRSVCLLGFALMALPAPSAAADLPAWLAGCWIEEKGENWTEECWTDPRAGSMLGTGRSGTGDRLRSWEAMQIIVADPATKSEATFWGAPGGQGRTAFALQPGGGPGVTFVNAAHDFPQRIRYWRDGEFLNAEASLADGRRALRWRYRRH